MEAAFIFLDCGALNRDILKSVIEAKISIEAIAAFEPDKNNFQKLATFVNDNQVHLPKFISLFYNRIT